MNSVFFVIVQCLLLSVHISLCSDTNCEIRSEPCDLENGADLGECKIISQCESDLFLQNTTYYPEPSDELVCCKHHVRQTRDSKPRLRTNTKVNPKRRRRQQNNRQRQNNNQQRASTKQKGLDVITPVVGGRDAKRGEFPFMAALGFPATSGGYDFRCGGFFVSPNRVVTAAHCARSRGISPVVVLPGGANLDSRDSKIPISSIIRHPSYKPRQVYNDIAVLKLSRNSPNPPAQLWRTAINFNWAIAIGYGHTEFGGKISNVLQRVALSLFSNSFCSRFYKPERRIESGLINSQLCAGELKNPVDTCQGDSGGPLLINVNSNGKRVPYIIGITSFGTGCAGGVPSIYTRISSYVNWIESIR